MGSSALGYRPALDGLRGVAVAAVLLYHSGFEWAKGGFLGVSTFFTLSGFLITTILLFEHSTTGTIDRRQFWSRRLRRLMPASLLTLGLVVLFARFAADPSQVARLRGDVLSALAYVANWRFIATGAAYGDLFSAPSPVLHFWSLAIEEQFYLAYPLLLGALISLLRWSQRLVAFALALASVASALWMAVIADPGPGLSRAYYHTGARAAELLIGAAAAALLMGRTQRSSRAARYLLGGCGLIALAVSLSAYSSVTWSSSRLYEGGFAAFALITTVLVLASVQRSGPVVRILSVQPLRLLGVISYGVYLLHWPVFLWLTPATVGLDGGVLFVLRASVVVALASASYVLLEHPIRQGRMLRGRAPFVLAPAAVLAVFVGATAVTADSPDDPLAVLATEVEVASAPELPVPGVDRPARVLVVGDAVAADVAYALQRWSPDGSMIVLDSSGAPCGPAIIEASYEGQRVSTCEGWLEAWTAALDEHRPDAVLVMSATWTTTEMLSAGELDVSDPGAPTWLRRRLADATRLLGAGGAVVSVAEFPHPEGPDGFPDVPDEVRELMWRLNDVAVSTDGVELVARASELPTYPVAVGEPDRSAVSLWADEVAAVVGPRLLDLLRNSPARDVTRIMLVGDSVAWFLGRGLEHWGRESGLAVVWNTGSWGCGIARGGLIRTAFGELPPEPECDDWPNRWRAQVQDFQPDLVVVLTGLWDLTDRRLSGWDSFRHIGDPTFDEYLVDEYTDAVDLLTSGGAAIAWLLTPCNAETIFPGPLHQTGALEPSRLRHLNTSVLPLLQSRRPHLELVDLFHVVCPNGEFEPSLGGIYGARPDGVHFTEEAAIWVAERIGPQLIEAAIGSPESSRRSKYPEGGGP